MDINQRDDPYPSNIYQERQRVFPNILVRISKSRWQNDFVYLYFTRLISKYRKYVCRYYGCLNLICDLKRDNHRVWEVFRKLELVILLAVASPDNVHLPIKTVPLCLAQWSILRKEKENDLVVSSDRSESCDRDWGAIRRCTFEAHREFRR